MIHLPTDVTWLIAIGPIVENWPLGGVADERFRRCSSSAVGELCNDVVTTSKSVKLPSNNNSLTFVTAKDEVCSVKWDNIKLNLNYLDKLTNSLRFIKRFRCECGGLALVNQLPDVNPIQSELWRCGNKFKVCARCDHLCGRIEWWTWPFFPSARIPELLFRIKWMHHGRDGSHKNAAVESVATLHWLIEFFRKSWTQ